MNEQKGERIIVKEDENHLRYYVAALVLHSKEKAEPYYPRINILEISPEGEVSYLALDARGPSFSWQD